MKIVIGDGIDVGPLQQAIYETIVEAAQAEAQARRKTHAQRLTLLGIDPAFRPEEDEQGSLFAL